MLSAKMIKKNSKYKTFKNSFGKIYYLAFVCLTLMKEQHIVAKESLQSFQSQMKCLSTVKLGHKIRAV
jgi:hypothetical protein